MFWGIWCCFFFLLMQFNNKCHKSPSLVHQGNQLFLVCLHDESSASVWHLFQTKLVKCLKREQQKLILKLAKS